MKPRSSLIVSMIVVGLFVLNCSKGGSTSGGGGSTVTTNYAVSGRLGSVSVAANAVQDGVTVMSTKTITHVIAISPATANAKAYVAAVGADGSFSLGLDSGKPYVFVFVDDTLVGENMIVGIFSPGSSGLDTIVPAAAGSVSLGTVDVNGTSQTATMTTTFADFLNGLGIDSTTAATIGAIDDLSLRAANPDLDSNGEIDALEGKSFSLDFHIRTTTSCSGCSQGAMPYDLISGTFISDVSGFAITPSGSSVYAIHPESFDTTPLTSYFNSGVSTTLSGGAGFAVTDMPGAGTADIDAASTYSGGTFSSFRQWGPDYSLSTSGIELPGYDHPVKMVWTLGNSKTLTYTHVRTRAKTSLFTLLPDFKFNVSGGVIASVDYRWRRWSGSAWVAATAAEVQLILGSESAAVRLYTTKSSGVEAGVNIAIPASSASGTLSWSGSAITTQGTLPVPLASMTVDHFCSGVASYDDKLGLRNFAYAFRPASSSSLAHCP